MSYQQVQQGYGQYNPYGQPENPYADQGNPYGNQPSYNQRPQAIPQGSSSYTDAEQGRTGYSQQGGYEMSNMNGNDPNRLLNETRDIDQAIDGLEQDLDRVKQLQRQHLDDTDASPRTQQEVEKLADETIVKYRGLTARVQKLRQDPQSGNPRNAPQVGKVKRRLQAVINKSQQQDSDYRSKLRERMAREYRIVRPDASDAEIREATEDPNNTQIFSQALINSDRRGQAQNVANTVRTRHKEIEKLEQSMIILAQLFQDLEAAVIQQEAAVTQIEERGEEVNTNVVTANKELDGAVKKARSARRKKWYCFGIVVLILIIIAVVVAVAVTVTNGHK